MLVLVACEWSGVVREAFRARGHSAWSCDLLPSEPPSDYHFEQDVLGILAPYKWDLMIAHPPCTHLAASGARWWKGKQSEQQDALAFVFRLLDAPIPRIALENPVGIISRAYRCPDQIIQPYQFGEDASKATCLWLKGLPKLQPTRYVPPGLIRPGVWGNQTPTGQNKLTSGRSKDRGRTYQGIAEAMAEQWGGGQ